MSPVGKSPPPFRMQIIVVGRQPAIGIAISPRETVVREERQALAKAPLKPEKEAVETRSGRGLELVVVAFNSIRPQPRIRHRCVDVTQSVLVDAIGVNVRERADQTFRQLSFDCNVVVNSIRSPEIRIEGIHA